MLFSQIAAKDVVNVINGEILGNVNDLEIEPNSGQIFCIYIDRRFGLLNSLFGRREQIRIPWDQIVKIGEDVIIVNYPKSTHDI